MSKQNPQRSLQNLLREFDQNELTWKRKGGEETLKQLSPYLDDLQTHAEAFHWIWKRLQKEDPDTCRSLRKLFCRWLDKTPRDRLGDYPLPRTDQVQDLLYSKDRDLLAKLLYGALQAKAWDDGWTDLLRSTFRSPDSFEVPGYLKTAIAECWDQIGDIALLQQFWQPSEPPDALIEAIERFLQKHPDRIAVLQDYLPRKKAIALSWSSGEDEWLQARLTQEPDGVKDLLEMCCLAIDLESDGNDIREIGVFSQGKKRCFYPRPGTDLPTALAELARLCDQAALILGHNLLYWDRPILQHHKLTLNSQKIWDTLHVAFLLQPSAPTHTLGARHQAADDAALAFDRFRKQVGSFTPQQLIALLRRAQTAEGDPSPPIYAMVTPQERPATAPLPSRPPSLVLLTPAEVPRWWWRTGFQWWPGTRAPHFRPLDLDRLSARLRTLDTPGAQVLSAVLGWAQNHDISVCPAMLPLWLTEADARLAEAIKTAPTALAKTAMQVSPLPTRQAELAGELASPCPIVGATDAPLWLETDAPVPPEVSSRAPQTLTVKSAGDGWWIFSPLRQRLTPRLAWYRVQALPCNALQTRNDAALPEPTIWLADRLMPYPDGANPQAAWLDLLERLAAWRKEKAKALTLLVLPEGAPHQCVSIIQAAWCEAEKIPPPSSHHSRAEWLRQQAACQGVLVVRLEELATWLTLAKHLDLTCRLALAELPLHRWWAREYEEEGPKETASSTDPDAAVEEMGCEEDIQDCEPVALGLSKPTTATATPWRRRVSELYDAHRHDWLAYWIPADAPITSIVLLDARLEAIPTAERRAVPQWDDRQRQRARQALASLAPPQRRSPPTDLPSYEAFLRTHWGHAAFTPEQRPIVAAIVPYDRHVTAILPTGGGKSVLFQVPALLRGGHSRRLILVVSPLRALMEDQVVNLRHRKFDENVDYLSADRPWFEVNDVYQRLLDGQLTLLYPESVISITERPIFHILLVVNGIFPLMSFRFMYEKSF